MNIELDVYDDYIANLPSFYVGLKNIDNKDKVNEFIKKIEEGLIEVSNIIEGGFKGKIQFNKDKTFISIRASEHIWLTLDAQTPIEKLPFMFLNYRSFEPHIPFFNAMLLMEKKETIFQLSHNNYLNSDIKEHEMTHFCKLLSKEIEIKMKNTFDIMYQNDFLTSIHYFYNFINHNKKVNFEEDFIDILDFKNQEELFLLKYDAEKFNKNDNNFKKTNKI